MSAFPVPFIFILRRKYSDLSYTGFNHAFKFFFLQEASTYYANLIDNPQFVFDLEQRNRKIKITPPYERV